ncbi:hypothetical protein Bca4012_058226 [Brassica carinata]
MNFTIQRFFQPVHLRVPGLRRSFKPSHEAAFTRTTHVLQEGSISFSENPNRKNCSGKSGVMINFQESAKPKSSMERLDNGEVQVLQVRSSENSADLFTKSLPMCTFKKLTHQIGICRLKDFQ